MEIDNCVLDESFVSSLFIDNDAIELIRKLTPYLEGHIPIRFILDKYPPIKSNMFPNEMEGKLAQYVIIVTDYVFINTKITQNDVVAAISILIHSILDTGFSIFPKTDSLLYIKNCYPVYLISEICKASPNNAFFMGEAVKQLIKMRKSYPRYIPDELQTNIYLNYPHIVPISDEETKTICFYLGTNKLSYVNILFNCVCELTDHIKSWKNYCFSANEIIDICKSGWFSLFLLAVDMINYNKENSNNIIN